MILDYFQSLDVWITSIVTSWIVASVRIAFVTMSSRSASVGIEDDRHAAMAADTSCTFVVHTLRDKLEVFAALGVYPPNLLGIETGAVGVVNL